MIPRAAWGGLERPGPDPVAADVVLMGVPWDGSACWRAGAAEAPGRLREISATSPAVSELGELVDASRFGVRDLGDARVERAPGPAGESVTERCFAGVEAAWRKALAAEPRPFGLALGGDHSVSIPLVRAFAGVDESPFGLVLLDAHPDLFDVYDSSRLSNACPMRRALETGRLDPSHLAIVGTRSYNAVELEFMRAERIRFVPAREVDQRGIDNVVAEVRGRLAGLERVYLSVDIDVADPACAPGTGAPVAGGLTSRQLLDLVRGLHDGLPIRAMDIVEIAPSLDPTGATLFLGLQLLFETFAALARRRGATTS